MALRLHDTERRTLVPFEPDDPEDVRIYACGPTIYGHAHVGNFRTFVFYDLVHRALEWLGYRVRFVMNLTDVDDKTIRAAREAGTDLPGWTEPFRESFLRDADALAMRRFDAYPKATAHVDAMIELVATLLEREMAYVAEDGSVYFDISAFPEYGRLSGRDLEEGRQGERVLADEHDKNDVRDFALWKATAPGDEEVGAAWDAPWGRGRPGWHLECSAMSMAELGPSLDLHLGGEDLIFPHHEGEIAQSEGATGCRFVGTWLHVKHLRIQDRKMSKSLGNMLTLRELLEGGESAAAVRHQLVSTHYRTELNLGAEGLAGSRGAVARLVRFALRLEEAAGVTAGEAAELHPALSGDAPEAGWGGSVEAAEGQDAGSLDADRPGGGQELGGAGPVEAAAREALPRFRAALEDDLNVSGALAALFVFVKSVNPRLDGAAPRDAAAGLAALHSMDRVLGLLEAASAAQEEGSAADGREREEEFRAWVEERIRQRTEAREARDWARADALRDELGEAGVELEDGPSGTRWTRRDG
ncbi:MAG: cysteine--tRNA ligase [Gemmatimonadales bacterium]|nr:MAG: cysteine--tRNA ligase [Gemmatimonadales bacterium]